MHCFVRCGVFRNQIPLPVASDSVRYCTNTCFLSTAITGNGYCRDLNGSLHRLLSRMVNCVFRRIVLLFCVTMKIFVFRQWQ